MRVDNWHRATAVAGTLLAIGACAPFLRGGGQPMYPLVVNNRNDFEVVVYAIPSTGGSGIRLGNALPFATTNMKVPRNALQGTQTLVMKLHSIGATKRCAGISSQCNRSPSVYTAPATVDSGVVVYLDIHADHSGGLANSVVHTDVAPEAIVATAGTKPPR
jgi:hypothetical protein